MSSGCPEPAGPAQPHDAGVHSTADPLNLHAVACKAPPHQQIQQQQEQQPQQLQLEPRPYSDPKLTTPDNSLALQRGARWVSESGSVLSTLSTITTNPTLPTAQGAEGSEEPLAGTATSATSAPSAAVSSQLRLQQQQQHMAALQDGPGSAPAAHNQQQPSAELASTAAPAAAAAAAAQVQAPSAPPESQQHEHTAHTGQQVVAEAATAAHQAGQQQRFAGTAGHPGLPAAVAAQLGGGGLFDAVNQAATAAPQPAPAPRSGDRSFAAAGQAAGAAAAAVTVSGDGPFGAAGQAAGAAAMSGDGPFGAAGQAAGAAAAAPPPPPPPPAAPLAAAPMSGDGPFGAAGQAAGAAAAPPPPPPPPPPPAPLAAAPMSGEGPFGAAGQAAGAAPMSGDGPFGAAGQAAGAAPMSGDGPFGAAGQAAGGHQLPQPGLLGGLAALQQHPTGEDLEAGFEAEYAGWAQVPVFDGINTCSIGHDGDCHLLDLMASGAFGAVHQGTYFNRPVAVKLLSAGLGDTLEVMQQRLQAEVGLHLRAAAFEGVVRLIAVCFSPPAIVMEQCQCSLAHRILNTWAVEQQHGQAEASWQLIMQLLADAASTLEFLHRPHQAVFHNDLRALNMLLKRTVRGEALTWELKVCDFGLSVIANSQNSMRVSPVTHHLWCAPEMEHADGGWLVNRQTDVYALGCVMEEMMTRPYHDQAVTHKHRQQQQQAVFPPTAELLAALRGTEPPARLQELFEQCVNVDAAMRPSAQTLARELYSLANPGPQW